MTQLGTGKYTYKLERDWAKMPKGEALGVVSRVVTCDGKRCRRCQRRLDCHSDWVVVRRHDSEPDLRALCRWHVEQRRTERGTTHRATAWVAVRVVVGAVANASQFWLSVMRRRQRGRRANTRATPRSIAAEEAERASVPRELTARSWRIRSGRGG